jgi:hypothetical protein
MPVLIAASQQERELEQSLSCGPVGLWRQFTTACNESLRWIKDKKIMNILP